MCWLTTGIPFPQSRLESVTDERVERLFAVSVTGLIVCAREAVRRMSTKARRQRRRHHHRLIHRCENGLSGGVCGLCRLKAAVDTLTIRPAKEVAGEGIRDPVRPTFIQTDLHAAGGEPDRLSRLRDRIPMRRGGTPEGVAHAILWLASEEASYVTGTFTDLAGGV